MVNVLYVKYCINFDRFDNSLQESTPDRYLISRHISRQLNYVLMLHANNNFKLHQQYLKQKSKKYGP